SAPWRASGPRHKHPSSLRGPQRRTAGGTPWGHTLIHVHASHARRRLTMKWFQRLLVTCAGCGLVLFGLSKVAWAETVACTAITPPATITAEGIYCLIQDFTLNMASGNAIDIQANNVELDLNSHKLGNLAAGPGTTARGIHALDRKNITIKNGSIRGF